MAFAVLFASIVPQSGAAQTLITGKTIVGAGWHRCEEIIRVYRSDGDLRPAVEWAQGYFSAKNIARNEDGEQLKDLSPFGDDQLNLEVRLVNYCFENPEGLLINGIDNIFNDLPSFAQ